MKFKTAIIGCGTVAAVHLKALAQLDHVDLAAVCDCDSQKISKCPAGVNFYTDYREMLDTEVLDAVHICLPHYLHYDAAKACAKRGVNVLCEKPGSMNREQLLKMLQLEQEYDFRLAVCLQNRLNPTFRQLQQLIQSEQYGRLIGIKAIAVWSRGMDYYEASPWRASMAQAGGGCMINQALHTLDQMQQLGGRILSVNGQINNLLHQNIEVEDTASAHIEFEHGVSGTFFGTVSYVKNSSIELQVVCEKGTLTIKDYGLYEALAGAENEKNLLIRDSRLDGDKSYYGASHQELIRGFYQELAGQTGNWVSAREEGQVILLIEAIRRSSEERRRIVWQEEGYHALR